MGFLLPDLSGLCWGARSLIQDPRKEACGHLVFQMGPGEPVQFLGGCQLVLSFRVSPFCLLKFLVVLGAPPTHLALIFRCPMASCLL